MLDSFLTDFVEIRDTLGKEGNHNFFGRDFSFFSAEPILFYNNQKDVIVYANSMFSSEFNYAISDLEEWKYSILPLINKDDQVSFQEAMKALLDGDENALCPDASYRLVNKNSKHSYYRVKVRKLFKSYYYIQLENSSKSAIPVLKNKTADELMSNAEAILNFGFWMWDVAGDKIYWTKGMYYLLEYDTDAQMDIPITSEFYNSHIQKNVAYLEFEKRFKEGSVKDSYRNKLQLKTNKGNIITVFEHGKIEVDENGKIKFITGITRDITPQEESMKSLADYKVMMLENETFLNYGTWESDAEGKSIFWTDGMYNIFGYDEEEKKNVKISREFYSLHMNSNDYLNGRERNIMQYNTEDTYRWDYTIKDNKGIMKILSTYGKVFRNANNEVEKIIGTTRDVTELRGYEKLLENKIQELNRSNRELEEFAYVASHDLQEPLRKISTFSQRLQLKFFDKLGVDGNLYITRVISACENMRKLIDNLLEFSKINLNNSPPQLINLSAVVSNAMEDLDLIIAETNTIVTIGLLPDIEAVSSQMLQLFGNMFSNSIKFRKQDTPLQININSVLLNTRQKEQYMLPVDSIYYMVTIQDNGIGFEQQYASKIFQLFQRLEGKSEYPGTGIGLSICKKIVNNHHGIIFAEGTPGEGAVFYIILPQFQ